ncbi:glutamyl-tRNA(Gln) amidotransferase subunit A domain protein [Mycobacterium kansasii 662]|uniref:Glutamyl-tRNA(Gln) amidotransferase subunit A domain protein n=1 Tax=Mycobacterium kansasii 662 TaxID=1299326 RepID=X7XR86_MYCKA|nr:glutamyl-tRNA(Gln) amidotransferase subunit A domain protein [Mycobacterium kansasii 662]
MSAAGCRIEPPVSDPMASGAWNAASAAALPPPEPRVPVDVPRVAGRAVGGVLGRGAHRELVHVGLAEDRDAAARNRAVTVAS